MLGDQVPVPAQQGGGLDEPASEESVGEQSGEPGQHRPIGWLEGWSMHLAPQHGHLVSQGDDFDGEIGVSAADEPDQLKDAAECPIDNDRTITGCSPYPTPGVKAQVGLLRQYMPKGTDLSLLSEADLDRIARSLNNRPRKTPDCLKSSERLSELLAHIS